MLFWGQLERRLHMKKNWGGRYPFGNPMILLCTCNLRPPTFDSAVIWFRDLENLVK